MTSPQSTVNVPAVGPVRRQWLFVGAAVVAVVVGYAYYKRSRKAPSTVYDPSQGTVDLGTGGYQNPAPTSPNSGPIPGESDTITTNDQWAQVAVTRLVEAGYNQQYAAVTIGKYLAGQPLDENELDTVRAAFALAGNPPQYIAPVARPTTTQPLPTPTPDPTPTPTPTPSPTPRPGSLVAPANVNLYDWSQATEAQYNIHDYQIIDRCRETGRMKWGNTSDPNGYPYFSEPTSVRLG